MRNLEVLVTAVCAVFALGVEGKARSHMGLAQFGYLINLYTGRNPLDFNAYGNYCGFGGSGDPVDEIDTCCQAHDNCYDTTTCPNPQIYYTPYLFRVRGNTATCIRFQSTCRRNLCNCDVTCAQCFADNIASYDANNKRG